MVKRLFLSIALLSVAAFAFGGAAMAWWSTSPGSATVSISAGNAKLEVNVDVDCDGSWSGYTGTYSGTLSWSNIAPGDTTKDCFKVKNTGDITLNVYLKHGSWSSPWAPLGNAVEFRAIPGTSGNWYTANSAAFTSDNGGRGAKIGTVAPGDELSFEVRARLLDDGTDQNNLQGKSFSFDATLNGYSN